ncbi:hypothetical protein JD276_12650 [Leucobacter sp. CSA1]|uniref:Uncharacterized protein n=1 Tax=Leucobacter chromiisoli TaxID=2796471 RepID=A0A934Q7V5_9MICO|nr:hypothetical protein [Leucobacter chromiisoli]MBK0419880.1 hypothetical protein [Leucobacter chromiisoli]
MSDERVRDAGEASAPSDAGASAPGGEPGGSADGLLDRVGLIESQPLAQRAAGFEQLHDELLAELQRSDQSGSGAGPGSPAPQGNGA